jgi:hypothetical protein
MEVEIYVEVLLTLPPACRCQAGGSSCKEEKKLAVRDYARFLFCKKSRRLRDASNVKTVSKATNKNKAKYVSMFV